MNITLFYSRFVIVRGSGRYYHSSPVALMTETCRCAKYIAKLNIFEKKNVFVHFQNVISL